MVNAERSPVSCPIPDLAALSFSRTLAACTNLRRLPPSSTVLPACRLSLMSDLPRLGGLRAPAEYHRLVERAPGRWSSDAGPCARVHELRVVRGEGFRAVCGGWRGERGPAVGCGG